MTDKRIVYTQGDGRVVVLTPAPSYRNADEAEDAFLARVAAKDVPAGHAFTIMDKADAPYADLK
jgi:hypothetical protein